jgi:hypothetical protein
MSLARTQRANRGPGHLARDGEMERHKGHMWDRHQVAEQTEGISLSQSWPRDWVEKQPFLKSADGW